MFVVNRDINVFPGTVDVDLEFSHPVAVTGSPKLLLEAGDVDAVARYAPAVKQYVDVGVYASAALTGGQFQVSYGKMKTACVDYDNGQSVSYGSLKRRLEELPEVASIGVRSVSRETRGNGFRYVSRWRQLSPLLLLPPSPPVPSRYTVEFNPSQQLKQLEAVAAGSLTACSPLLPNDGSAKVEIPADSKLSFRYVMSRGARLLLRANQDIPKNSALALSVPASYGVLAPLGGMSNENTHMHANLGFSSVDANFNMMHPSKFATIANPLGSFSRTAVSFAPNKPNTVVAVQASFALNNDLAIGESVYVRRERASKIRSLLI
jgi:hypothetical protein